MRDSDADPGSNDATLFELEAVGGLWGRRLEPRRAGLDELAWGEIGARSSPDDREAARVVWTESAFSEYASAAAFAAIATALLEAGAPIDLTAAAGEFVADEMFHAELSARVAMALGGAVPLEVDLTRLARPATPGGSALRRAAELVVRTSCVGEALTVPVLRLARQQASGALAGILGRIARDEAQHAQLGPWFLDWAEGRLTDDDRAHLGVVAGETIRSFSPLFARGCVPSSSLGVLACDDYDAVFARALDQRVVGPLAERGIAVPVADLAALGITR